MRQAVLALGVLALVMSHEGVATGESLDSPPGKIVFYSERDGNAEIYVMDPDGTNLVRLTRNASNEFCPDWSPDGTQIAYESDRDDPNPVRCFPNCTSRIYVMDADGTDERRLMDLPGTEGHLDWSPDGRSIVFQADRDADGKNEIYVVSAEGGEPRVVIDDGFDDTAPDWSPDGTSIAFSSDRGGSLDIFVIGVDGTGLRKIVDTGISDYFPDWAPDGREILFFAADWPRIRQDICVVEVDGPGLARLTDTPRVADESAQWAPDGERIVFQSDRDGNFEIYSMARDGTDVVRLTRSAGGDYWPDLWLPRPAAVAEQTAVAQASAEASSSDTEASALADAAEAALAARRPIAFVSTRAGHAQIYTMNADGSEATRLTNEPRDTYYPAWSPDGARLAYYAHLSWQAWALVVIDADGSNRRQITESTGCSTCAMGPYWSPDGARIGFTVEPNPRPTCEMKSTELAIVNADGSECRRLTDNSANDVFGGWSPDGGTILFASDREGSDQVYLMASDGSYVRRLTDLASTNHMPAWSPDGTRIAFVSNRDGNDDIYVMGSDGSNVTRVTFDPSADWMPAWSADGAEILFSSDRGGTELDVYAVRLDDLSVRRLTSAPGYDYEPTWRPWRR